MGKCAGRVAALFYPFNYLRPDHRKYPPSKSDDKLLYNDVIHNIYDIR